jgi:hypothetical protein
MNRGGWRGEQRWDYRHSKKSDRVFRKLNALALPGSAATGIHVPPLRGSTPFFGITGFAFGRSGLTFLGLSETR